MRPIRYLSFPIFFSLLTTVIARPWTPNDDLNIGIPAPNSVQITVQHISNNGLHLTFRAPDVKFEQVTAGNRNWTFAHIEGETRRWETGMPSVPVISRPVLLPNTGNIRLKVVSSEFKEYSNIDILPQQPIVKDGETDFIAEPYACDTVAYSRDGWYPGNIAEIHEPVILRDARIALLGVQPVQVNPVTHKVRVYTSIELETESIGGTGVNELYSTRQHPAPGFVQFYQDILGADELAEINAEASPGSMLVICRPDSEVTNALRPYIEWRNRSGRPTTLITTTATAATQLQNIINSAYANNVPPLEMIMLVGDGGTTGSYSLPTYMTNSYTDHTYVQLAGNDVIADAYISRWPASNIQQLLTMVNRSINYERNPNMMDTTWFQKGWGYSGTSYPFNRDAVWFCMTEMNSRGVPWSGIYYDEHSGNAVTNVINSRCNPGLLFWAHRPNGVGNIDGTYVTGVTTNINKCFVSIHVTCGSGHWYPGDSTVGTQKQLVLNGTPTQPAGAIASMATETSSTHSAPNCCILTGSFYALGAKNAMHPGEMFFEGKYQVWRNYLGSMNQFIYWNNPMGDISAKLWTGVPHRVAATVPHQIAFGQNRLEFTVNGYDNPEPISGALVTAVKSNPSGDGYETYVRTTTDNNGHVVLPLTNSTTGNLYVTVVGAKVGQNILPLLDTVSVANMYADVGITGYNILDNNGSGRYGNNDSLASPGETVDVNIQLRNLGTRDTVTGISATLLSTDSRIVVSNSTQTYTNIAPGESSYGSGIYRLQLLEGLKEETVLLQLNITTGDSALNRSLAVVLPVHSIHLSLVSSMFSPSPIIPGGSGSIYITVQNNGSISTGATNAHLFPLSSNITVNNSDITFGGLPIGQSSSNPINQPFTISTNLHTVPGSVGEVGVAFGDNAIQDTVYINVPIGTRTRFDPVGPDTYGYSAIDDSDTVYTLHPTFDWQNIETSSNRLELNDFSMGGDASMLIRLPFTVRYYGADYDTITVCTNGWISFGAARVEDYTGTPPVHESHLIHTARVWRFPSNEGPRNMVAVGWQDLTLNNYPQGVFGYYDQTNGWYVITWKGVWQSTAASTNKYQLLIYDPQRYTTPTGDSQLKFQYKDLHPGIAINEIGYVTIGIQDSNCVRSLEYAAGGSFDGGASPIAYGSNVNRAILFTTTMSGLYIGQASNPYPENLATNVPTNTTLSWRAAPGAMYYDIRFGSTTEPPIVSLHQRMQLYVPTLSANTTYYWRVTARLDTMDTVSNTGPIWAFTTGSGPAPAAPSNVCFTNVTSHRITVNWLDHSTDETSFSITQFTNGSAGYTQVANLPPNTTSYIDSCVQPGTQYWYRIYSYNNYSASITYASGSVWTLPARAGSPQLHLSGDGYTTLLIDSISADSNSSSMRYMIFDTVSYTWIDQSGRLATLDTMLGTKSDWRSILVSGLVSGTDYCFAAIPINGAGISGEASPPTHITTNNPDTGGPDSFGYRYITSNAPDGPAFKWLANTGSNMNYPTFGTPDDGYYGPIDIGFDFQFYGTVYTQFYISTNGYISFGQGSSQRPIFGSWPELGCPAGIFFWGCDGSIGGTSVRCQNISGELNQMVINLDTYHTCGTYSTPTISCQIILNEQSEIMLQYQDYVGYPQQSYPGNIGLQTSNGNDYNFAYCNSWSHIPATGTAILFYSLGKPSNPSPPNGAVNIPTNSLIGWHQASLAIGYNVYFGTVNPPPTRVSYRQTGLDFAPTMSPNTTYFWRVVAIKDLPQSESNSSPIWSFTTGMGPAPLAPTNCVIDSAADATINSLHLHWTSTTGGSERGFYVYSSTDGANFTIRDSVGSNVLDYTNTGLQPNKKYWYRIYSYNENYPSMQYAEGTGYTLACTPGMPTFYSATPNGISMNFGASVRNGNSVSTEYAIRLTNIGLYLQANGCPDTGIFWRTAVQWGDPTRFHNLHSNTLYTVQIVARNGANIPTAYGAVDSFSTITGLTGIKYIGGSHPDYPTIRAAIDAVNLIGTGTGGVTFLIRGGTYNELPDSILPSSLSSPLTPIAFKPADTLGVTINLSCSETAQYGLKLFNVNNVTIDGGIPDYAGRKFISVFASGLNGYTGLWFANGASNCCVKNCVIGAGSNLTSSFMAVRVGNNVEQIPDAACNNDSIINCSITGGYYGMYFYGNSTGFQNLYVANNVISNYTYMGVFIYSVSNSLFLHNEIAGSTGRSSVYGIFSSTTVNISNIFDGNWIHGLVANSGFAYGIYLNHGIGTLVTNNMIDLAPTRSGTVYGIFAGADPANIVNNTIHIAGSAGFTDVSSAALFLSSDISQDTIANNIFINERGSGLNASYYNACIATPHAYSNTLFNYCDYNAMSNANDTTLDNRYVAHFGTNGYNLISDLRQIPGYLWDSHSINYMPVFLNSSDLHIDPSQPTLVESAGLHLPYVVKDFDGDLRDSLHPDIGCDEGNFILLTVSSPNENSPRQFELSSNYPNPFNPVTQISFTLPLSSRVTFEVFDATGRKVINVLANETVSAGRHTIVLDAAKWATGVYFYRIEAGKYMATRKMVLLK